MSETLQDYPSGNITFVFTDIEKSTDITNLIGGPTYSEKLNQPHRERWLPCLQKHHGFEVNRAGDGHMFVFQDVNEALACVVEFQQSLEEEPIEHEGHQVRVRIGVHHTMKDVKPTHMTLMAPKGVEATKLPEYPGIDTNYAARIGGLGAGGQIIISSETCTRAGSIHDDVYGGEHLLYPWPGRVLKGFDRPQDVYEILYLPMQAPREPGIRYFPSFYVGEKNRYIQRAEKEDEVLRHFWQRKNDGTMARLVSLKAEGGMGKTRLAVACAVRLVGAFDDGAYFVSLARDEFSESAAELPAPSAADVNAAISAALRESNIEVPPDAIFDFLKSKNLLLVLDNYECFVPRKTEGESVPDAVAEYLVQLTRLPGVCFLMTGRQTVGVDDIEQIVHLEEGLSREQGRQLFLARATLKWGPGRELSDDENAQLDRILQFTSVEPEKTDSGGIPLAIELAAAWVGKRTLKEIADEIETTPLGEMTAAAGTRASDDETFYRHRSLTRSLEWSYKVLYRVHGPATQRAFSTCGLFADSFAVEVLQEIFGDKKTRRHLDNLVDASLVRFNNETGRYRLHRFTRAYAREKLSDLADGDAITKRFLVFYVQLATENRNINDDAARALLDAEWRNIIGASETAEKTGQHILVAAFTAVMQFFLQLRSYWREWELLELSALRSAKAMSDRGLESAFLNGLGLSQLAQGRLDEAVKSYKKALLISQEIGNREEEGRSLNNLGAAYQKLEEWTDALKYAWQAQSIAREEGNQLELCRSLNTMGTIYQSASQWDFAITCHEEALSIARQIPDKREIFSNLNNLGRCYLLSGQNKNSKESIEFFEKSLMIKRDLGDRVGVGRTLLNIAIAHFSAGEHDKATRYARESVEALQGTQAVDDLARSSGLLEELEEILENEA